MKFSTGWAACAALVLAATTANAQVPRSGPAGARYIAVSDLDGPYAPPYVPAPPPRYGYGYEYQRGPGLLPAEEVYSVLREYGFSPLGKPHLRGYHYTVAVVDRRGDDGHLVIDARDGRILRFIPADGDGPAFEDDAMSPYGAQAALPPPTAIRGVPRPPAPIPHVASRTVPVPRVAPPRGEVPAEAVRPAAEPASQQATARPQETAAAPQSAVPAIGQARPPATILPTTDMPPVQGLE